MPKLLFLCTGNYYRSRFAEFYFRHLAAERGVEWSVDSRGLALDSYNEGPMYHRTRAECERLGVSVEPVRFPLACTDEDLRASDLVVAVKEAEHRPLMREKHPHYEETVEYWAVHDLDAATPEEAFPQLRRHVEGLIDRLAAG